MNNHNYLDLHVIQTIPPNCVNRDDTGSPKTAFYGGTMRARVSSQAWKRAMRQMFKELMPEDILGYRTKHVEELVNECVKTIAPEIPDETRVGTVEKVLHSIDKTKSNNKATKKVLSEDVLFFISNLQVKALAKIVVDYYNETNIDDEKKKQYVQSVKDALKGNPSIDILLFGRMSAGDTFYNYDAAAQVAHAISTHTVSNEYDYFTAVDDYQQKDTTGAAHIDTTEFNSSTLYRYATVNISELSKNLTKDELSLALKGFTESFIRSMPTGKQNSFANRTLPNFVYVTIRSDQPANFAGAFEKPVTSIDGGYVEKSETALIEYANKVYSDYISRPEKAWVIGKELDDTVDKVNLIELLSQIEEIAKSCSTEGE
ncbi:MAG: type I-E CRISPR-associated protein Cas7/Cse4/CasC [Anaerovoracaceae bacterium]|jgi:CRISPR system Cascade subunit CasC